MKLLILAGGSGTRLWPLSTANEPKQVQPFLDKRTLLQYTWQRLRRGFVRRDIFVATTQKHLGLVERQLPELLPSHTIVEPVARNTAPAIGLAARVIRRMYPDEVVATVNSDHYVKQSSSYLKALRVAERIVRASPNSLLLFGIKPTYPETGYGYIEPQTRVPTRGGIRVFTVKRFIEKPNLPQARLYQQTMWWNSGIFVFYPQLLVALLAQHSPRLHQRLGRLRLSQDGKRRWRAPESGYRQLPDVSFDYAVVEHTRNLQVLPVSFGWADVGHWRTLYDILAKPKGDNVVRGKYIGLGSYGNLIYNQTKKLVATVGIKDLVIVETDRALLVCQKARAQEVRQLVVKLKQVGLEQFV